MKETSGSRSARIAVFKMQRRARQLGIAEKQQPALMKGQQQDITKRPAALSPVKMARLDSLSVRYRASMNGALQRMADLGVAPEFLAASLPFHMQWIARGLEYMQGGPLNPLATRASQFRTRGR
jgi:hypothetical protein